MASDNLNSSIEESLPPEMHRHGLAMAPSALQELFASSMNGSPLSSIAQSSPEIPTGTLPPPPPPAAAANPSILGQPATQRAGSTPLHIPGFEQLVAFTAGAPQVAAPVTQNGAPNAGFLSFSINNTPTAPRGGGRRSRGLRRAPSPPKPISPASDTIIVDAGMIATPNGAGPSPRSATASVRGSRTRGPRGGREGARGGKRKRTRSGGHDDGGGASDSSEEFSSLPSQPRSGRRIFQATGTPVVKVEPGVASSAMPAPASARSSGARGRVGGRGGGSHRRTPGAAAVCLNCGRGHSPAANAIVFCDGCNRPWHQYCHHPPIRAEVTQIAEMEWFCTDCVVLREERAKIKGRVADESSSLLEVSAYCVALCVRNCVLLTLTRPSEAEISAGSTTA